MEVGVTFYDLDENNVVLCDYFTPKSDDFNNSQYFEIEIMEHGHKPKVINMEQ